MASPPNFLFLGEPVFEAFNGLPPFLEEFPIPPAACREIMAAWMVVKRRHFSEGVSHIYPWNFFTPAWKSANGIPPGTTNVHAVALCMKSKAFTIRLYDNPAVPRPSDFEQDYPGECRDPIAYPNDIRMMRDEGVWFYEGALFGNFGVDYGGGGVQPLVRGLPALDFPVRHEFSKFVESFGRRTGWWYPLTWTRSQMWRLRVTRYTEFCNFPATTNETFPTVSNTGWLTDRYWTFGGGCCCC